MKKGQGFSLLELLIVVMIFGILITFAQHSYVNYQITVNRTNVQTEMLRVSQQLQEFKMVNKTYSKLNPLGKTNSKNFPEGVIKPYYTLSLTLANNDQTFELKATPVADTIQNGDGQICLNNKHQKSWDLGQVACKLSDTTKWYGE